MADPSSPAQPGGVDEVAVAAAPLVDLATGVTLGPLERVQIVATEVSEAKLAAELEDWHGLAAHYWDYRRALLLRHEGLTVDIGMAVPFILTPQTAVPMLAAVFRLDYTNYDLEPPSLTFIDPFTGNPTTPVLPGIEVVDGRERNLVLGNHPITGLTFFCQAGVAEFHLHPQHDDDSWLNEHRALGSGRLANIVDRVWRAMTQDAFLSLVSGIQVGRKASDLVAQAEDGGPVIDGGDIVDAAE